MVYKKKTVQCQLQLIAYGWREELRVKRNAILYL